MYNPPSFEVTDPAWAIELIDRHPFGLLITCDATYPRASHLPLICRRQQDWLQIIGHVARANPQVESIRSEVTATAVFHGPHAYVSASWYVEPYATVPTWNYTAVHVVGRLQPFDAWEAVKLLSHRMEGSTGGAWDPEQLSPRYRENQLRGIVAFQLRAEAVYAKAKLSQNRTPADRERVWAKLAASDEQTERECARAMTLTENPPPV